MERIARNAGSSPDCGAARLHPGYAGVDYSKSATAAWYDFIAAR
jgi:hypothetical protein